MKRIYAFKYAIDGIVAFFRSEQNARIHVPAAASAIALGFCLHITRHEWIAILLCISAVFCMEMINTAIEKLCNIVHPAYHSQIKMIKDIAAGAVLLSAVASLVIGAMIFLPKFF
jgi:diacylglycerol kinase